MRILAVSDEENNFLWSERVKNIARGIDLIISCGDLKNEYLEFLLTMGGICIDGKIYKIGGLRFLGLGGSMRYRQGRNMYTEREMKIRFLKILPRLWINRGFDILVTHSPAKNYGDLQDLAHSGFETFNAIINKYKPKYMLHGHIHTNYTRIKKEYLHESGTKIFNVCGYKIIEI